ncbi:MAG: DUF5681 domain-containing protein [Thiolinea sp.]
MAGNPAWVKGGKSPNPSGRPKGAPTSQTQLAKLLKDRADDVVQTVVNAALAGDMQAANIVVSRIIPPLKSEAQKVTFQFDASQPLSKQVEQVLQAISEGKVAPDGGKQLIELIGSLGTIRQMDEYEARLKALEAKNDIPV